MIRPIALILAASLAAPALAAGAPETSTRPLGRACQCISQPQGDDTKTQNAEARRAASQVAAYDAKIRENRREQAQVEYDFRNHPVTRGLLTQELTVERRRLTSLRNKAAARLQAASYGGTEGVPHGDSIPERDR